MNKQYEDKQRRIPDSQLRLSASDVGLPRTSSLMSHLRIPDFARPLVSRRFFEYLRQIRAHLIKRTFPRELQFEQTREDVLAGASMSIIVPIHDAPLVTCRCLASLQKYSAAAEVILVDDASQSLECLQIIQRFSKRNGWRVIRNEKSLGHSEACRAGVRFASRPYLCLLNSDTMVTPWCWRRMQETFVHNPGIGVAGPSTSLSGNIQTVALASKLRLYWDEHQICSFANRLLSECPAPVIVDLEWVSGFALFIRRSLWAHLDGFDRNLPDYGNEVELCRRVIRCGYRNVWVRDCYIHHLGGQSYIETIGVEEILLRAAAAADYLRSSTSRSAETHQRTL